MSHKSLRRYLIETTIYHRQYNDSVMMAKKNLFNRSILITFFLLPMNLLDLLNHFLEQTRKKTTKKSTIIIIKITNQMCRPFNSNVYIKHTQTENAFNLK